MTSYGVAAKFLTQLSAANVQHRLFPFLWLRRDVRCYSRSTDRSKLPVRYISKKLRDVNQTQQTAPVEICPKDGIPSTSGSSDFRRKTFDGTKGLHITGDKSKLLNAKDRLSNALLDSKYEHSDKFGKAAEVVARQSLTYERDGLDQHFNLNRELSNDGLVDEEYVEVPKPALEETDLSNVNIKGKELKHSEEFGKEVTVKEVRRVNELAIDRGKAAEAVVRESLTYKTNGLSQDLNSYPELSNDGLLDEEYTEAPEEVYGEPHLISRNVKGKCDRTKQGAEKLAVQLLGKRAYTAVELRKKLTAKQFPLNIVEALLRDFRSRGLINDGLYAETFSHSRWKSSTWGPRRIKQSWLPLIGHSENTEAPEEVYGEPHLISRNVKGKCDRTKQGAEKLAVQLLGKRAYTAVELRKKLTAKQFPLNIVEALLRDFRSRGLINDGLYAETFSHSRWKSSTWGPRRIKQALTQKGVSETDVKKAAKLVFEDSEESDENASIKLSSASLQQLYKQASKQWQRSQNAPHETRKSRVIRWLQYRGFDWGVVGTIMKKLETECPR